LKLEDNAATISVATDQMNVETTLSGSNTLVDIKIASDALQFLHLLQYQSLLDEQKADIRRSGWFKKSLKCTDIVASRIISFLKLSGTDCLFSNKKEGGIHCRSLLRSTFNADSMSTIAFEGILKHFSTRKPQNLIVDGIRASIAEKASSSEDLGRDVGHSFPPKAFSEGEIDKVFTFYNEPSDSSIEDDCVHPSIADGDRLPVKEKETMSGPDMKETLIELPLPLSDGISECSKVDETSDRPLITVETSTIRTQYPSLTKKETKDLDLVERKPFGMDKQGCVSGSMLKTLSDKDTHVCKEVWILRLLT
jgi:hypothetical protein